MSYVGDIRLGDTIDVKFTTRSFTTGAPTTLAGTPAISAYPGNSTTQLTAGITLTVDFDTVTGLHNVRVVATSGNGYATATNYYLVITTGTVGGVSVVGEVVGSFSIEARSAIMPTTAGRTLDVTATGAAGIDWANVENPTTALNLSATNIDVDQVVASVSGAVGSVTGAVGSVTGNVGGNVAGSVNSVTTAVTVGTNNDKTGYSLTATTGLGNQTANITGNLSGSVGSVTGAVGSVTAGVTLAASAVQAIWDALTTALTTVGSVGKLLVDNVNATISSRSSHSAADVWAAATRTLTSAANITSTGGTTVPQTGDSFARLGAPAGASVSADIATRATPAQVNAEVVDALATDTYAEPGQGAPAATTTLAAKINYLYKAWRNRTTQTSTTYSLYADDATTVDQKATVSDDGTTFDRTEIATGP